MAMTAPTWRYVGSATPAANTAAGLLDALHTLGTSTTYYDGSARTPGSGVALTSTQHKVGGITECVDLAPVTATHGVRYLYAGSASARTPTMVSSPNSDTWATATLLLGVARSWNTYNATGNGWDQTLPGGVGSTFTGYVRAFACGSLTATKVHLWECADAHCIIVQQAAGATLMGAGLHLDSRVTNATSPTTAEATTGGRYLMWNTSAAAACDTGFHRNTGVTVPFSVSGINSGHCYLLSVGGVTLTAVKKAAPFTDGFDTTSCITADGDWIPLPIELVSGSNNVPVGVLRGIRCGPDRKIGDTFSVSGVVKGYALSSHPTTDNDTLWLIA